MAGSGTRRYESGDVYEGDFSRGLRHGEGALRCVGGESYEGALTPSRAPTPEHQPEPEPWPYP